jgi:putative flippase GtrA
MHVEFWTNGIWTFHAERNGEMDEIHSAEVEGC